MPGENYRWRMLGAAVYAAEQLASLPSSLSDYDGVIVTDLFNLADFKAFTGRACPPVMVYFHENQLTYPTPRGDRSAFMLGMINITTALVADRIAFNSHTHREAFLRAVPEFLSRAKDCRPATVHHQIREKSMVLYPGITVPALERPAPCPQPSPPLVIWNHRWGFDKNYRLFLKVLEELCAGGLDFQVALMGENFGKIPGEFIRARDILKDRIVTFGHVPSRNDYYTWLKQGTVVVSTAVQENFGMSVIEAALMGCFPLLPARLSYPEILPAAFHAHCLYKNKRDLIEKLGDIITNAPAYAALTKGLSAKLRVFLWENRIPAIDAALGALALNRGLRFYD